MLHEFNFDNMSVILKSLAEGYESSVLWCLKFALVYFKDMFLWWQHVLTLFSLICLLSGLISHVPRTLFQIAGERARQRSNICIKINECLQQGVYIIANWPFTCYIYKTSNINLNQQMIMTRSILEYDRWEH